MKKYLVAISLISTLISCSTPKQTSVASTTLLREPNLSEIKYEGGDGKTIENLILIKNAKNEQNGIASEYVYIGKIHGERFKDWKPLGQSTITKNGKKIDIINIEVATSKEKITYFFDITDFYGKF